MTKNGGKDTPGSAGPASSHETKNAAEEGKTWGERNGGKVIGFLTFGLLSLATFLMWLANNT